MSREENVIKYYVLCNQLKNVIRTGWKDWNVKRDRIESVAEHIYGTQMLAIAMKSEFNYDVDLSKVIFMLAIHELGETVIGDLTPFQINRKEKEKIEHEAVHNILGALVKGKKIEELFLEFDSRITEEAKFAYQCDKLECDIQSKIYDEEKCVDLSDQNNNETIDEEVKNLLNSKDSFSNMWIKYDQGKCSYDKNFFAVTEYLLKHKINGDDNQ